MTITGSARVFDIYKRQALLQRPGGSEVSTDGKFLSSAC